MPRQAVGGHILQAAQRLRRAACPSAVSARWVVAQAGGWPGLVRVGALASCQRGTGLCLWAGAKRSAANALCSTGRIVKACGGLRRQPVQALE